MGEDEVEWWSSTVRCNYTDRVQFSLHGGGQDVYIIYDDRNGCGNKDIYS